MNDKTLTDIFNLRSGVPALDDGQLDVRPDDYQAFRIDPQLRPSNALLDFWFANGNQRAISYNHLYDVDYDRSKGLVITFSEHLVKLEGYCLDDLYGGLKRHRIAFIWEASPQQALLADDEQPMVTKIDIDIRHASATSISDPPK